MLLLTGPRLARLAPPLRGILDTPTLRLHTWIYSIGVSSPGSRFAINLAAGNAFGDSVSKRRRVLLMVTAAMDTVGGTEFDQLGRKTWEIGADIRRFWSLKNKFPASSRRLATLPMTAAQAPEDSGHGARRSRNKHRVNRPSTRCATVGWPVGESRRTREIRHSVVKRCEAGGFSWGGEERRGEERK
jgi:hypothetical protein